MKKTTIKNELSHITEVLSNIICSDDLSSKNILILMEALSNIKKVRDEI